MELEYNHEKACSVVDLVRENKIAKINVSKIDKVYMLKFELVSNFSETKRDKIAELLDQSKSRKIELISLLNKLIEYQTLNILRDIYIDFDATGDKCSLQYAISSNAITEPPVLINSINRTLDNLKKQVRQMGIGDTAINLYKKSKKYRKNIYQELKLTEALDIISMELNKR